MRLPRWIHSLFSNWTLTIKLTATIFKTIARRRIGNHFILSDPKSRLRAWRLAICRRHHILSPLHLTGSRDQSLHERQFAYRLSKEGLLFLCAIEKVVTMIQSNFEIALDGSPSRGVMAIEKSAYPTDDVRRSRIFINPPFFHLDPFSSKATSFVVRHPQDHQIISHQRGLRFYSSVMCWYHMVLKITSCLQLMNHQHQHQRILFIASSRSHSGSD